MFFFVNFATVGKRKRKSKFRRRSVRVCKDIGNISGLSDELLIKILSFLPTRVAVSTSILSKQWQFLWMWLPKLDYNITYRPAVRDFIDKNLPLHKAPVIESLRLCVSSSRIKPEDIKRWVEIAVSRYVRELKISYYYSDDENIFPSSFYTCKSVVILKLSGVTLMDVPSMVCLPSLKTLKLVRLTLMDLPSMVRLPSLKALELESIAYADDESLQRLLSICPVLEDLSLHFDGEHRMGEFTVIVPTLKSLSLFIANAWYLDGYVIDTPSLEYFKLEDWNSSDHHSEIKNMPKLREAYVDVVFYVLESVIGAITSVKHLTICSEIPKTGGEDVYGGGFLFNQLEHLQLCVCKKDSSNLLAQLLQDSPNLQVLDISHMEYHGYDELNRMGCWNQPSPVPECLLSSLQIFKWSRYFGRAQDRDIAVYILKNARHLKTVTILADAMEHDVPTLRMIKELTLSSRSSSTCELVFDERNIKYTGGSIFFDSNN